MHAKTCRASTVSLLPKIKAEVVVRTHNRRNVLHDNAVNWRITAAKNRSGCSENRSRHSRCANIPAACPTGRQRRFKAAIDDQVRPFGPNRIVTSTCIDRIIASTTRDRIDSPTTSDNIVARTAIDGIVAIATGQIVITRSAADRVVANATGVRIGLSRRRVGIVTGGSFGIGCRDAR